ncbi:hypothetical protein H696_02650 [Fonticula alba]|uniref:Uncharacterized protein n=1 Tax=Fonticula alba TaxID=691883 RepID=A0A058Z869_FONAL|nr:hypothetical protein H696_02650 [Fonticula alba]KCV70321.1 hypothetical protein H696_02650 [Fonticula alba]|eukprot:XP_009494837.1 hypothetical protein H696_02650 [Fonticula alba]
MAELWDYLVGKIKNGMNEMGLHVSRRDFPARLVPSYPPAPVPPGEPLAIPTIRETTTNCWSFIKISSFILALGSYPLSLAITDAIYGERYTWRRRNITFLALAIPLALANAVYIRNTHLSCMPHNYYRGTYFHYNPTHLPDDNHIPR